MKDQTIIRVQKVVHRGKSVIMMNFPKNSTLIDRVKKLAGRMYSATYGGWYIPDDKDGVERIQRIFEGVAVVDTSAIASSDDGVNLPDIEHPTKGPIESGLSTKQELSPFHVQAMRMMEQQLQFKGYSASTLKTYLQQFKEFLFFYNQTHVVDINEVDIRNYILFMVERRKLSRSTQNQAINAIKFFYEKVLKQDRKVYYIERPLKEKRLPEVLSQQQIISIFEAIANLKHRLMLMIIYASGLRRSELLNLRIGDVDTDRRVVFIRGGKGRKDRQSILAESIIPLINQYLLEFQPRFWFFEGRNGERYSATSLQAILKRGAKGAGVKKNVRLHMLRHSFATHLLENGTSTRYIQELLGHESPVTTEIYAQVTRFGLDKLRSPLDQIVSSKQLRGDDDS